MKKTRLPSAGNITVRLPYPLPADRGSALRRKLKNLIGSAGECCAFNSEAMPSGKPGWCYSLTLKHPTSTPQWADQVEAYLKNEAVPLETTLEISLLRGPMEVDLLTLEGAAADWRRVLFPADVAASARIALETTGRMQAFEDFRDHYAHATAAIGTITNAYQTPAAANVVLAVQDASNLAAGLASLAGQLDVYAPQQPVRVTVSTRTFPQIRPLFPGAE